MSGLSIFDSTSYAGLGRQRTSRSPDVAPRTSAISIVEGGGNTREECWRCAMVIGGLWRFPSLGQNPMKDSIVGGKDAAGDACHLNTSFNLTTAVFNYKSP